MARRAKGKDLINPPHYQKGEYETIDVIEDVIPFYEPGEAYAIGSIIAYLGRAPHKGDKVNDLKKAKWYLDRLIEQIE